MPTLRVFQVAKLLKVDGEEILDALSDMGISVTSNLAPLDEAIVKELKELFKPKPQAAAGPAATPATAAPVANSAPAEKQPAAPARKIPAAEAAKKLALRKNVKAPAETRPAAATGAPHAPPATAGTGPGAAQAPAPAAGA